jgi:hypothetical protein
VDECCTSGGGELAWAFAASRGFGRPSCGTVHPLSAIQIETFLEHALEMAYDLPQKISA